MNGTNVNLFFASERMTDFFKDGLSERANNSIFTPIYHKNPHQRHEDNDSGGGRVEQGGSLGIYTKSYVMLENKGVAEIFNKSVTRVERYALQDKARKILTQTVQRGDKWAYVHRVNYCLHCRIDKNKGVGLMYNKERQNANFSNVQRCYSVWNCPVCSAIISEGRRAELRQGLDNWKNDGGFVYLVTFTNRHHCGDRLGDLLASQKKAFVKFWSKTKVVKMLKTLGFEYRITATEVTYGDNGWHPHYHMIFFFKHEINRQALQSFLALEWQIACQKSGLKAPDLVHGVDVQDGTYASQYVSKWGLDYEMTKGHTKKGKEGGLTPFDLLRLSQDPKDDYARLFREFADVFKGRRQLVWSDGLKERLGIEQKTDEQIVDETEKKSELVRELSAEIWYLVKRYNARAKILDLFEQDYLDDGSRVNDFVMDLARKFIDDMG